MKSGRYFLAVLVTVLVSACGYWPDNLEPLANAISKQVGGETTAWLLGSDVVVINVAYSPLYNEREAVLETVATDIAVQSVEFVPDVLESIAVTFYEREITEDSGKIREFFFVLVDGQPKLQPLLAGNAMGPLSVEEIQSVFSSADVAHGDSHERCLTGEITDLASEAGDPETLDPETLEYLPADGWKNLDRFGKRLILAQAISTQAYFNCIELR